MSKSFTDEIFDKIVDKDNIWKAYKKALKGDGKYHIEAMKFGKDEVYNLEMLRQSLIDESYKFDGYVSFQVYEPKERLIHAPHFKDKIVQLAINNILKEIYNPTFIFDSYACIDNKGTHKCVDRLQHFMRKAKWQYGEDAYIIKGDIRKFFYSIDRAVLKRLFKKKIKCDKTLKLLSKIIDSSDGLSPLGLPLGNTLSQISANVYLNELDQYCKRKLSLKYYVRYMDDFFIIIEDKNKAKEVLNLIKSFVENELHLNLNENKSKIFPINQGINAIGYKVYATHRLLRNDSKKKIKRKTDAMPGLIITGKLNITRAEQILNSWLGHAGHCDSYNFIQGLLEKHNFLYFDKYGNKTVFKINESKLKDDEYGNGL